jgi:hypothetical protein
MIRGKFLTINKGVPMGFVINLIDAEAVVSAAKRLVQEQGIGYSEAVSSIEAAAVLGIESTLWIFRNELLRPDAAIAAEINERLGKI